MHNFSSCVLDTTVVIKALFSPTRTPVPRRTQQAGEKHCQGDGPLAGKDAKHAGGAAADDKDLTQYGNTDQDP